MGFSGGRPETATATAGEETDRGRASRRPITAEQGPRSTPNELLHRDAARRAAPVLIQSEAVLTLLNLELPLVPVTPNYKLQRAVRFDGDSPGALIGPGGFRHETHGMAVEPEPLAAAAIPGRNYPGQTVVGGIRLQADGVLDEVQDGHDPRPADEIPS